MPKSSISFRSLSALSLRTANAEDAVDATSALNNIMSDCAYPNMSDAAPAALAISLLVSSTLDLPKISP